MVELSLSRVSPPHALAVAAYAESLVFGRRVVVVGDATSGLGERLLALGARIVHVYDSGRDRVQKAPPTKGLTVRELPPAEFDVRDGAFDLAIVTDLAEVRDAAGLLARIRRVVAAEGAAIVVAKNAAANTGAGIDYYDLFDVVSLQFANVRMLAQLPFVGVTIAELGDQAETNVSVDTQLAGEMPPPEYFIALASQEDTRLEPYAIVQLPFEPTASSSSSSSVLVASPSARIDDDSRVALAAARLQVEALQAQVSEHRAELARSAADESKRARATEIEAERDQLVSKLKDAEQRAGDNHVRAERYTHDIKKLEEELERQRERAFRLAREVEDEKKLRQKAELELGMVRGNPELSALRNKLIAAEEKLRAAQAVEFSAAARAELEQALRERAEQAALLAEERDRLQAKVASLASEQSAGVDDEFAALEAQLRERAKTIKSLEDEVIRREKLVRDLVSELDEARTLGSVASVVASAPNVDQAQEVAPGNQKPTYEPSLQMRAALHHAEALRNENEQLRNKLEALALEAARRQGEVQTSTWQIEELQRELAQLRANGKSEHGARYDEGPRERGPSERGASDRGPSDRGPSDHGTSDPRG